MHLMRCHPTGDLYPIITDFTKTQVSQPSSFSAISPVMWHARLGHPGSLVFNSLKNNKLSDCKRTSVSSVCQSCVFGKHVKLPFYDSVSHTCMLFDICHSNLWTSPVLNSAGHKYYTSC